MKNRLALWQTYRQAREFGSKPSEIVGLTAGSWEAFCFDEACFMWGRHVESTLRDATKKAKNENQAQTRAMMVMKRLMAEPEEEEEAGEESTPAPTGKFRDPAAKMKG